MFAPEQLAEHVDSATPLVAASGLGITSSGTTNGKSQSKPGTAKNKKKASSAVNVRNWLRIDQNGETSMMQADKYKLTHKLGVQGRDLRIMDPSLATSYPSAILCRDKALVISLEHIKVIITTGNVLVMNPEDENVLPFITELKMKISQPSLAVGGSYPAALNEMATGKAVMASRSAAKLETLAALQMPFELKALEVCLDSIASYLNRLTSDLEAAAYPALDSLTSRVTAHNLERVRRIKSRLVRLTTRVENVREVLEGYLDDDQDMKDMNLTAKEQHALHQEMEAQAKSSSKHTSNGSSSSSSSSSSSNSSVEEEEIAEVEMLLEAYFMHVDNTYNRLQTLNEYIQDTEDLVNLKLDQHRNQLIGIDLILTSFTCALAIMTAVAGYFGMNLNSYLQEEPVLFQLVTLVSLFGALSLFGAFVAFLWFRQLLVF